MTAERDLHAATLPRDEEVFRSVGETFFTFALIGFDIPYGVPDSPRLGVALARSKPPLGMSLSETVNSVSLREMNDF